MNNTDLQTKFKNFRRTWHVSASLPIEFSIQYSNGIFDISNLDILSCCEMNRSIVVIEKTVFALYGNQMLDYFAHHNCQLSYLIIEASEETKTWDNVDTILHFLEDTKILRRAEPIIAIGGGVLLDLVGFCASIYRRGIPYIKIPTTLLAIVDASVGVKVGTNHLGRRNRIGAYYPPLVSLLDKSFIKTLPEDEIINGLGEIFKIALIKDAELFNLLEKNAKQLLTEKFQTGAIPVRIINLAITDMVEELAPNLWERRLDRCVDFGHSFSPLIEMNNIPGLSHGKAVVLDCLLSTCIAFNRQYIDRDTLYKIFWVAEILGLPTFHTDFTDVSLLILALSDTIKHRNGNQYLPVPTQIGQFKMVNDLTDEEIEIAVGIFVRMEYIR